ncbi:uncharacterized protein LACBIDRAFT_335439 [Laccaria bicolor S238N-H82]|uniref:Predicted protein n=1 Tax=Laccaria bicolor (strain S238N-H82 / ATCC MYA-4686) TaxID=486041 RepID=B0E2C1_LACBS|nr:uncharacterized protein LACBIDRAFT_335439 [Laccaria bicolor S238N-H82]EDQ99002.1 predicted protein [Laccaria bicolor S238N-H82]|eukprot:XP_001890339.1 predicted protein [Laccaria bicolor S238N-H82]
MQVGFSPLLLVCIFELSKRGACLVVKRTPASSPNPRQVSGERISSLLVLHIVLHNEFSFFEEWARFQTTDLSVTKKVMSQPNSAHENQQYAKHCKESFLIATIIGVRNFVGCIMINPFQTLCEGDWERHQPNLISTTGLGEVQENVKRKRYTTSEVLSGGAFPSKLRAMTGCMQYPNLLMFYSKPTPPIFSFLANPGTNNLPIMRVGIIPQSLADVHASTPPNVFTLLP